MEVVDFRNYVDVRTLDKPLTNWIYICHMFPSLFDIFFEQFLRAVWFSLRERVSALDELDMCTTRLRLLLPGERLADDKHVIHPLQVGSCSTTGCKRPSGVDNECDFDYRYSFLVRPNSWKKFAKSLSGQISWPSSGLLRELLKIS